MSVPHARADAASANTQKGNGGKVRGADVCADAANVNLGTLPCKKLRQHHTALSYFATDEL